MSGADPHEGRPRLPRFAKDDSAEALFAAVNDALRVAELPPVGAAGAAELALVYVVGTPRSGTTLAHQLLASCLDLGYIDNLAARFWLRPSVGIGLSRLVNGEHGRSIELRSEHGATPGATGPHEFGYFWRHWLGLDRARTHHLDAAELERIDSDGLRETLRGEILAPFGRSVVLKNLVCGLQARFLAALHPQSLFVSVTREEQATARSILAARRLRYGDYHAWWSLKPSTWPFPESEPEAQVVRQVREIRSELQLELGAPGIHAITVSYESICADPQRFLERVAAAVGELAGVTPAETAPPPQLAPSQSPPLPGELEERLRLALYGS